jgi:hypothetical protein
MADEMFRFLVAAIVALALLWVFFSIIGGVSFP